MAETVTKRPLKLGKETFGWELIKCILPYITKFIVCLASLSIHIKYRSQKRSLWLFLPNSLCVQLPNHTNQTHL